MLSSVPGAVVPGIAAYTRSGLLYYSDEPENYRNNEACVFDAASFLFAALALDPHGTAPIYLPLVTQP